MQQRQQHRLLHEQHLRSNGIKGRRFNLHMSSLPPFIGHFLFDRTPGLRKFTPYLLFMQASEVILSPGASRYFGAGRT